MAEKDTAATEGSSFDEWGTDAFVSTREIGDSAIVWDFDNGPLIGTYQGVKQVEYTDSDGNDKLTNLYRFANKKGEITMSVWGCYDLDTKLADVKVGTLLKVEYLGMETIKAGKQQLRRYRVIAAA